MGHGTMGWTALRGATAALVIASAPAGAQPMLAVSYSFAGGLTAPPSVVGSTLILDGQSTGTVTSSDPVRDALWNPVTLTDHNEVELTTGLSTGTFVMAFTGGDRLFGDLFENLSQVLPTNTGPFTQRLEIRGGTGMFAGARGVLTGGGQVTATGFGSAGSGTVTLAPEPMSVALLGGGLLGIWAARRRPGRMAP